MSATKRLPEQLHYRDTGCEFSPRCVDCPLPVCKEEAWAVLHKDITTLRLEVKLRPLLAEGKSVDECAEVLGRSRRSVFRLKQNMSAGVFP